VENERRTLQVNIVSVWWG